MRLYHSSSKIVFALVIILALAMPIAGAYEIEGNSVTYEDTHIYYSATPHTLTSDGWVEIDFISKQYTGDVDVGFGFDTSSSKPKEMERWTGSEWVDFGSDYDIINYEHDGKDRWYMLYDKPIVSGNNYKVRVWVDINEFTSGKYDFAIKPSGETLSQAISNGHFYLLDPWWNSTFQYYTEITLSNSGPELTDQTIYMFLEKNESINVDCSDVRFTSDDNVAIPYYIDFCNSTNIEVYIRPETIDASSNTTIKMYFGNADAETTSSGIDTFLYYDDFEDGDLSEYTLEDTPAIDTSNCYEGSYCLFIDDTSVNQFAFVTGSDYGPDKVLVAYVRQDNDSTQGPYMGHLFGSSDTNNWYWTRFLADAGGDDDRLSLRKNIASSQSSPGDQDYSTKVPIQEYFKAVTTWESTGTITLQYYTTSRALANTKVYSSESQLTDGRVGIGGYRYSHIDNFFVYDYYDTVNYYIGNNTEYYFGSEIEITSPENTSYPSVPINVNLTTSLGLYNCTYNIDGGENITLLNSTPINWYGNVSVETSGTYIFTAYCLNQTDNYIYNSVWFTYTEGAGPSIEYNYTCPSDLFDLSDACANEWTSATCSDNNTLTMVGNCSLEWIEGSTNYLCQTVRTKNVNCPNGCYEGVTELGATCSPPDYWIYIIGFIVLILGIVFFDFVFKKKRGKR